MTDDNFYKGDDIELHKFYCGIAREFMSLSKDPKTRVGCVIVTPEGILYPGYNGDEIGGDNVRDSMEPGQSGFIHAEENAMIKFNPTIHKGSIAYISHEPCKMCARKIVNTRAIVRVFYNIPYPYGTSEGIELLEKRNIPCKRLPY